MGDQGTTAYILISGEVKITTTVGDRTHCEVASLGNTLTAGAECLLGRPHLASVHPVTPTDALVAGSTDLDQLNHGDPCLAQVIRRNLASG